MFRIAFRTALHHMLPLTYYLLCFTLRCFILRNIYITDYLKTPAPIYQKTRMKFRNILEIDFLKTN